MINWMKVYNRLLCISCRSILKLRSVQHLRIPLRHIRVQFQSELRQNFVVHKNFIDLFLDVCFSISWVHTHRVSERWLELLGIIARDLLLGDKDELNREESSLRDGLHLDEGGVGVLQSYGVATLVVIFKCRRNSVVVESIISSSFIEVDSNNLNVNAIMIMWKDEWLWIVEWVITSMISYVLTKWVLFSGGPPASGLI